ncbi:MAG: YIP1 family protein [Mangrovicoccus sp.]|nr:YIP1 family protein [Mangrovicoccus sp.]
MLGLGLLFVSQLPRLAREAALDPQIPLEARLAGAFFGWLCLAPLAFYGLAGLSRIVARALGSGLSWPGARLALFWALLAASPLALLQGLVTGLVGPGVVAAGVGLLFLGILIYLWFAGLAEAGREPAPAAAGQQG